jgi:cobalamin biosynthesis protein CobT
MEDDLIWARPLGQPHEFPEWYRPGSAPWFERGEAGKKVHPSARQSDTQTIIVPPRGDVAAYRALWSEVQREAGYLLTRLIHCLQEETYLRYTGRFRSGKLAMSRLWRQRLADYRLFQRREGTGRRQVAFSVLVDESASMKGRGKDQTAAKAAVLLGECLSRLEVPFEIIGFTTSDFEARSALRLGLTPAHAYRTMRCSRLEHRIYKSFDESYRAVRTRLAELRPRHNNWDEEHLLFAYRRLRRRPERMKVLIVISDGQPNGEADSLMAAVAGVEREGGRVIGIGVGEDFVLQIYRDAIVVSDFQQMAEAVVGVLARQLGVRRPVFEFAPALRGGSEVGLR